MYYGISPDTNTYTRDSFTGNGSNVNFTLSKIPVSNTAVLVYVGGAVQQPPSYTISSTTLTFSTAPVNGVSVLVIHL